MLNPNGPFVLLNPISKLLAGETHVLTLSFSPHESILVSPRPTLRHAAARVLGPPGAAGPPRPSPLRQAGGGHRAQSSVGSSLPRPTCSQQSSSTCLWQTSAPC